MTPRGDVGKAAGLGSRQPGVGPGAAALLTPAGALRLHRGPRRPVPGHAAAWRLWLGTTSVLVLFSFVVGLLMATRICVSSTVDFHQAIMLTFL